MSKRNFTLLIIILVIVIIAFFGWVYFRNSPQEGEVVDENTSFLARFNPFRSNPPSTPSPSSPAPTPTPSGNEEIPVGEATEVKLRKISSMPVAGFGVYQKERYKEEVLTPTPGGVGVPTSGKSQSVGTEFVPAVRYVDRANGNIYQTFADEIDERKFSTTVIPKVYEAYFGNKGTTVVMRYLKPDDKTIQTFVGNLPKEVLGGDTTGDNTVIGSFLPDNITDMSLSADASKIFYLFNLGTNSESSIGTTLELLNNKKVQVFDNAFTEWLSSWPNSKNITLTTKPAAGVLGYMYAIDLNNKSFSRVMGEVSGLTTLMGPSGKLVLYGDSSLSLSLYNIDTKTSAPVGLKTMPEKCVWGRASDVFYCSVPTFIPSGQYPDSWYRGEVSFTDQIWKVDIATGTTSLILNPSIIENGEAIDGIKLALDGGENYLFFVNKKDSYLWELDLRQ